MPWKKKRRRGCLKHSLYWIAFAWASVLKDDVAVAIVAFIIMLMLVNDSLGD